MSTNLGPRLPDALVRYFSGNELRAKMGEACVLVTQGADGYPHPMIVTPGEIVAGDPSTMRLALYAESTASRNLRATPQATLCHAQDGAGYYVKGDVEPFATDAPALKGLAVFTFRPRHVLQDAEPGAQVTSSFRFHDDAGEDARLAQWEPVVKALRDSFA
ncbi:MAG TPA: hypothetical protein VFC51_14255 [Chloroflexota bacterium]|nr:hypothetical protein [Chloroflexota bacterium]